MNYISKECLEKITGWLVYHKVDHKVAERLMKDKPGLFPEGERFPRNGYEAMEMLRNPQTYGMDLVDSDPENLSCTIEDILNAIAQRNVWGYQGGGRLSKEYVIQIAGMLNLDVVEKTKKSEIVDLVLRRM